MSNSTYCDDHYEQPEWMKRMERLQRKIKELEKELDRLPVWRHGTPPNSGWWLTRTTHGDGRVTIACETFRDGRWPHEGDGNVMYMDMNELETLPKED